MASKRTNGRAPRRPTPPNALSRQRRARLFAGRLAAQQEYRAEIELVQIANDADDTDQVPGVQPKQENGKVVYEDGQPVFPTYGELFAQADAGIARIVDEMERQGITRLVNALIEAEQAAEEEEPVQ